MDECREMLFHHLLRAHHNASAAALSARGANVSAPHLLMELAGYPDDPDRAPTQKELADRLHSAPPTVAASLKVLERQGYVERRTDEKDTRRNRVAITRKGRDVLETGMRALRQVDEYMYRGFTAQEREQVRQFHSRMLANLYQIGGDRRQEPPPEPPPPPMDPARNPFERKCEPC